MQGLIKSALVARLSGARRVVGFAGPYLRERPARAFYSEAVTPSGAVHVIEKNLSLLSALGIEVSEPAFPIDVPPPSERIAPVVAGGDFALVNPGGGWPNKRWPPDRLGQVARHLVDRHGLRVVVLWGPNEDVLAREVAEASDGRAEISPPTTLADLLALLDGASLLISGDSGPLHLAAALATPVVGIFGPTHPLRNGPWSPADEVVFRSEQCGCSHLRRCRQARWCLDDIGVEDVVAAADRRLGRPSVALADSPAHPLVHTLARRRVPLGFALSIVVLWFAAPTSTSLVYGAIVAGLGEALRLWAAGHLEKSREVTSSGPYRWTRHPLYVGSAIIGAGIATASASVVVADIGGALSRDHDRQRDSQRGTVPAGEIRPGLRCVCQRHRPGGGAPLQHGAGDA